MDLKAGLHCGLKGAFNLTFVSRVLLRYIVVLRPHNVLKTTVTYHFIYIYIFPTKVYFNHGTLPTATPIIKIKLNTIRKNM